VIRNHLFYCRMRLVTLCCITSLMVHEIVFLFVHLSHLSICIFCLFVYFAYLSILRLFCYFVCVFDLCVYLFILSICRFSLFLYISICRDDYSRLLSALYALVLILVGFLLPLTEALNENWNSSLYNLVILLNN